jgi:hypothetical protein
MLFQAGTTSVPGACSPCPPVLCTKSSRWIPRIPDVNRALPCDKTGPFERQHQACVSLKPSFFLLFSGSPFELQNLGCSCVFWGEAVSAECPMKGTHGEKEDHGTERKGPNRQM